MSDTYEDDEFENNEDNNRPVHLHQSDHNIFNPHSTNPDDEQYSSS